VGHVEDTRAQPAHADVQEVRHLVVPQAIDQVGHAPGPCHTHRHALYNGPSPSQTRADHHEKDEPRPAVKTVLRAHAGNADPQPRNAPGFSTYSNWIVSPR